MPGQVTAASVPDRELQVRVRKVAGQLTVALPDGASVQLSGSAALVWRSIDGRRTVHEVAALLAAEYDADTADVVEDVVEMVTDLADLGLLSVPA